jgi:hypothetical protein
MRAAGERDTYITSAGKPDLFSYSKIPAWLNGSNRHRYARGHRSSFVADENIGEMAVIECEGRIDRSEAAFKLREAVTSQRDARIIVLDLSEVFAIEGGGLGMLVFL